jgi:uncharacterized protein (TIGR03032 family)
VIGAKASVDADDLWARHNAQWRNAAQVASQWEAAGQTDPRLLQYTVTGRWWEAVAQAGVTVLVAREYEHLVMALKVGDDGPRLTYFNMPHPSGLAVDSTRVGVHVASTRNPNQVYEFAPAVGMLDRQDVSGEQFGDLPPLMPVTSTFFPGSLYLHDLAFINGALHGNAVGHNAVVRLDDNGTYERVWWPRAIERDGKANFGLNHLQLNSIAAGPDLAGSYFSASTELVSARRPGHRNFAVDGRGVVFSGATREPIARGLTRPHSARLRDHDLWVDNSGYGEVGACQDGRFEPVVRLPGWTRGLYLVDDVAFVGTSRILPRFRHYAPGLDPDHSLCGVHAVALPSGTPLGSLIWPSGNQIFAIDGIPAARTSGFPFVVGKRRASQEKTLFYTFATNGSPYDRKL